MYTKIKKKNKLEKKNKDILLLSYRDCTRFLIVDNKRSIIAKTVNKILTNLLIILCVFSSVSSACV